MTSIGSSLHSTITLASADAVVGPNCRYGVAAWPDTLDWVDTLGTGWFLNFVSSSPPAPNGAEFVPVIRVRQDKLNETTYLPSYRTIPAISNGDLAATIANNPGRLWLVGNEPDVPFVQDDTFPDIYAQAYHDVYALIKSIDPTAQVGIGGLSMMTPGRIQYLDLAWDAYREQYGTGMPVDVWNFHLYILSEKGEHYEETGQQGAGKIALGTDPAIAKIGGSFTPDQCTDPFDDYYCHAEHDSLAIFAEQVMNIRRWMYAKGEQNKPLILSEYSILFPFVDYDDPINPTMCFLQDENGNCFTQARINAYMDATLDYMHNTTHPLYGNPSDENHLIQQWLWFSLYAPPETSGGSSSLLVGNYATFPSGSTAAFTSIGHNYRNHVYSRQLYVNLFAKRALSSVANTGTTGTATATIGVDFLNNGNAGVGLPFQVTFYRNAALTQPIDTISVNPLVEGCARQLQTLTAAWEGLAPGVYKYWAKVDSGNNISEGPVGNRESDNVVSGTVLVNPNAKTYIPFAPRR